MEDVICVPGKSHTTVMDRIVLSNRVEFSVDKINQLECCPYSVPQRAYSNFSRGPYEVSIVPYERIENMAVFTYTSRSLW